MGSNTRPRSCLVARGTRKRTGVDVTFNSFKLQERKRVTGRDIQNELWSVSGWSRERFKIPVRVLPCGPAMSALSEALEATSEEQRQFISAAFVANRARKGEAIAMAQIQPPELRKLVAAKLAEDEPHGPPQEVHVASFPIRTYLLFLFRAGRLKATGNLPGEIFSRGISPSDWGALEIAWSGTNT